jgi:hypothetical protein
MYAAPGSLESCASVPVLHGHDFWRRESGRLVATPLLWLLSSSKRPTSCLRSTPSLQC